MLPVPGPMAPSHTVGGAVRPRRFAIAIHASAWVVILACIAAGFLLLLATHEPDSGLAHRLAERELQGNVLDSGEVIQAQSVAFQRHWWDFFRPTWGVLAITDHRLVFLGVPPSPLIARQAGPREFEEEDFPLDTTVSLRAARVFDGTTNGIVVRSHDGRFVFGVPSWDRVRVQHVRDTLHARQVAQRREAEKEREAQLAAEWAARQPVYHTVQRGEALITIANQYGTTPEALEQLNHLPDARIRAGQRLLIRKGY